MPRQDRAQASIDAILTATERLLNEGGFARLTTNRIAARAGVNVALVYRYFAGKEAIVGALIDRAAQATSDAAESVLAAHAAAPLPIALRALLRALAETPGAPGLHRELVQNVEVTRRRTLLHALRVRLLDTFSRFLEQRRGELRALPDGEATLFVMQHAIEAASHAAAFYRPEGMSLERALEALAVVIERTLLADGARPQ